jgi:hypothetical protein
MNLKKKNYKFLVDALNVTDDPDPLVRGVDPQIRIRTKFHESATLDYTDQYRTQDVVHIHSRYFCYFYKIV